MTNPTVHTCLHSAIALQRDEQSLQRSLTPAPPCLRHADSELRRGIRAELRIRAKAIALLRADKLIAFGHLRLAADQASTGISNAISEIDFLVPSANLPYY